MPACIFPGLVPHPPSCPCNVEDSPPPRNLCDLPFDLILMILDHLSSFQDLYSLIRTCRNIALAWIAAEELIIITIGRKIVGSHVWREALMIVFYQRFFDQMEDPPKIDIEFYPKAEEPEGEVLTPAEVKPVNPIVKKEDIPQLLRNKMLFKEARCYLKAYLTPAGTATLSELCPRTDCVCSRDPWSPTEDKRIERAMYIMWYLAYGYEYMERDPKTRAKAFMRLKAVMVECYSVRERLGVGNLARMYAGPYGKHFGAHMKNCPRVHPWQRLAIFKYWVDTVLFPYNGCTSEFEEGDTFKRLDARTQSKFYDAITIRMDMSCLRFGQVRDCLGKANLVCDGEQETMSVLVDVYQEWVLLEKLRVPDPENPIEWIQKYSLEGAVEHPFP